MAAETTQDDAPVGEYPDVVLGQLRRHIENAQQDDVGWKARAEAAETKLDAVHEYCRQYRSVEGMDLACDDILDIISSDEGEDRG